jgi:hypothetical protein
MAISGTLGRFRRVAPCVLLLGCAGCYTSQGAKDAWERYARSRVGTLAESLRPELPHKMECSKQRNEYGCLTSDVRGCRTWFVVDEATTRITSWRYADEDHRDCWREWLL